MFPTDPTGELTRRRIADLHAEADHQRLARSVPGPQPAAPRPYVGRPTRLWWSPC